MPGSFLIRLCLNSIVLAVLLTAILLARKAFKHQLTPRIRYHLWFLFLFVLAVPFLPCSVLFPGCAVKLLQFLGSSFSPGNAGTMGAVYQTAAATEYFLQDFSVSVSRAAPPALPSALTGIWIAGMVFMAGFNIYSCQKIRQLKKSSLPLQNKEVRDLFAACREESGIKKEIPVYSSAYISSPIAAGLWKPCIIVPIHMLSGLSKKEIRYILLHELLHCKHKDLLVNRLMALAQIIYWFHPLVWFAFSEMRSDREIACDSSVLSLLDPDSYLDYGSTLINFAEKISLFSYSAARIGGSKKEIKKRILNIACYRRESRWYQVKSRILFTIITVVVLGCTPVLSADAYTGSQYVFAAENVTELDLTSYFCGYKGSFVLYELNSGQYCIYNREAGTRRVSPDSTYKIYSALAALEHGSITPEASLRSWDGTSYPFKAWNHDQTLDSAMEHSVNWYFTALDEKTGLSRLKQCLDDIGYGNRDLSGGLGRYWLESSLKISPVEQVKLLAHFCQDKLPFRQENIKAVKESIFLSSSKGASLYGKTGTGTVDGENVNGWFIGFVETGGETYVFATNIQGKTQANGTMAGKITLDILNDREIYTQLP
ncbi:BlaR1 family beta-lactam sensor/signal transducer [Lacrimispora indolis]|uniref:BlaR1 family beta-lactam sensor/signal transducer n=1 Tax=Lacrimispora indolis TaxID=69825 RepID=UPI000405817D|nr:BlaR1 family beta-lactam sensor/signal transducer [[Clostridium] methoxybenzovorans]